MDLEALAAEIRAYPGITRKRLISDVIGFFSKHYRANVLASYGDDAAVIEFGDSVLLFAADGIMEPIMKTNPYYAGYYAVLVNINDIFAMGGVPLAMVDVISMRDEKICAQVMRGMEAAVRKFGVPVVGGHTHPDCDYHAIDVAIVGTAKKDEVVYSHTARVGESVIIASDTDGFYPVGIPYAWDTTSRKPEELVRRQMLVMNKIAEHHLITSGKDISNPGSLGSLGMLLETSGKGAAVDLDLFPRPSNEDFLKWLKAYQGCGFVVTSPPETSQQVLEMFREVGVTATVVGRVDDSNKLVIRSEGQRAVLFDFDKDVITGCKPSARAK